MVPRVYMSENLAPGIQRIAPASVAHHLHHVLRRRSGDYVHLFNARDGEFQAIIERLDKNGATLRVGDQTRLPTPLPDIWLCFAPLKKEATDILIEKATELGVMELRPIATRRANVTRLNLERHSYNATLAAQQCERLSVPEIRSIVPLDTLLRDWPRERRLLACRERGKAPPIADVLAEFTRDVTAPNKWAILCGPEGGFDDAELDRIMELPFVTLVGLGPRILRAETAALAALAIFQAILGDGAQRPPDAATS